MATINLLYQSGYKINDSIEVVIPKVRDILNDEDSYYGLVSALTAMPIDMMAELDDCGIDFSSINEYELFLLLFNQVKNSDTSLIFGGLDLMQFSPAVNESTGSVALVNPVSGVIIDQSVHSKISSALRKIHNIKKDIRKPANEEARDYMLDRAREKRRRNRTRLRMSQLENLIIALVNTEQFKYDFDGVLDLSIYQFNESVRQIIRKIDYDNRMHGVYAGTISVKDLSQEDLSWLPNKL